MSEIIRRLPGPVEVSALVVAAAALLLAGSQFLDYRAVEVGAGAYEEVRAVAPAPQVDSESAGSAHGYAMVPLALAALALLAAALRGRWRLARLIAPLGLVAIAVTVLVDLPAAKDVGEARVVFEGVDYVLLAGFWVQLTSAAVLVAASIVLSVHLGAAARGSRPARRLRRSRPQEAGA